MIILDEPTSALDINSVKTLQCLIKENKKDKIFLKITHNEEFLNISDEIINLNDMCKLDYKINFSEN